MTDVKKFCEQANNFPRPRKLEVPVNFKFCALPNIFILSSIFKILKHDRRVEVFNEKGVHYHGDKDVFLFGEYLDISDCDVFLALIILSNNVLFGEEFTFKLYEVFKIIKQKSRPYVGSSDYSWLRKSLIRLRESTFIYSVIDEKSKSREFSRNIHFISELSFEDSGNVRCKLDTYLLRFFNENQYVVVDFEKKASLKNALAKSIYSIVGTTSRYQSWSFDWIRDRHGYKIDSYVLKKKIAYACNILIENDVISSWKWDHYNDRRLCIRIDRGY